MSIILSGPDDRNTPSIPELKHALKAMGPVSDEDKPPLLNPNNGQCKHCGVFLPMKDMPIHYTGITYVQEPLCGECRETFRDQARIACINCREVILWADPHRDPSGFTFEKRKIYHVQKCPTCDENVTQSRILEKVLYYEENNIPYE